MIRLPELKSKRLGEWKELVPRCASPLCGNGRGWSSVLHRSTGFRLDGEGWYCSAQCLGTALEEMLLTRLFDERRPAPNRTTMPMGLMMLSRGVISDPQLRDAIRMQHDSGARIGACLQRLGLATHQDIAGVVATQWGCPLFPPDSVQPGCSMLVPFSLIERYRMAPVHLVAQGRRLFVAFSERVNYTLLLAIEHMLACHTVACVIAEPRLQQVIEYRKNDTAGEVAVIRPGSAFEIARMILSYAQQSGAGEIRLRGVEGNIWVRLHNSRAHLDLVFEFGRG